MYKSWFTVLAWLKSCNDFIVHKKIKDTFVNIFSKYFANFA